MSNYVLITGANKGIGLESARQLAALGYKVLLGSRSEALGAAAVAKLKGDNPALDVELVVIDVVSEASIAAAAADVERRFGRLDVLVNNAGVAAGNMSGPLKDVNLVNARLDFEVNYFGTISTTQAFLPLLLKSALPRIVNLSSILGSHAEHADPASPIYGSGWWNYSASKAALNMYTQHLALALKDTPAKVNAAHPGWVKTDMGGEQAPYEVAEGAETTVYLATLGADGPTGGYFHKKTPLRW
mmetsp:Transcript_67983/g.79063  ORF Transcript_67983/g.79063 Transcript_67983/m.79063 type:complete len:244 (+) Transcript_67983:34-765(+)